MSAAFETGVPSHWRHRDARPAAVIEAAPEAVPMTDAEILDAEVRARADFDEARSSLDKAESALASLRAAVDGGSLAEAAEAARAIPAAEAEINAARILVERFTRTHGEAAALAGDVQRRQDEERRRVLSAEIDERRDAVAREVIEAIRAVDVLTRRWRALADEGRRVSGRVPHPLYEWTRRAVAGLCATAKEAIGTRF